MRNKLLFLFVSLVLLSCEEETQVNQVSGFYYQDCSQKPASNAQLALKTRIANSFSEVNIIGSAYVNSNGAFQFTYELEEGQTGIGDLMQVDENGGTTVLESVPLNQDKYLVLYSSLVPSKQSAVSIIIENNGTRQFTSQDTLYIGVSPLNTESFIVNPDSGKIDTLNVNITTQYNSTQVATLYYGIGLNEFNSSKTALGGTSAVSTHKSLILHPCSQTELVDLAIN